MEVKVVKNLLEANERIAHEIKEMFSSRGIYVVNLMSAPGAGKTTLVEKTVEALKDNWKIGIIEGDIATAIDAERISSHGIPVVQVNTGSACHLDGNMIRDALDELPLDSLDLLIVENVGNLVCPAEFKVGEDDKVMILSTPEGSDKPVKYPLMFQESSLLLINKIDLLPHIDCDLTTMKENARKVNPKLEIIEVSCKTGEGLDKWFAWLNKKIEQKTAGKN